MIINAFRIHGYSDNYSEKKSDVGIVLGAGTSNGSVSPIFRERINHGLKLLDENKIECLIFTVGYGDNQKLSDSKVAMIYSVNQGTDSNKIYIEEKSTITFNNLVYAREIMISNKLKTALIISDPYHMKRSLEMCKKLKIKSNPSPTPTTMFRSRKTKIKTLIYESFFYNIGVIQRHIKI